MVPMERYNVRIRKADHVASDNDIYLLIPYPPTATVKALIEEIVSRSTKRNLILSLTTHDVTLRLDQPDGPLLDVDDILSDVILDSRAERVFAVFHLKDTDTPMPDSSLTSLSGAPTDGDRELGIRVVTPELALNTTDTSVSNEASFYMSTASTVKQLHDSIARYLDITAPVQQQDIEEHTCNCTFGKRILNAQDPSSGAVEPNALIVVHGKSLVLRHDLDGIAAIPIANRSEHIKAILKDRFGTDVQDRLNVTFHNTPASATQELVVSLCSKSRHRPRNPAPPSVQGSTSASTDVVLDLHTSEVPITVSSYGVSLHKAGLSRLAKNGVVTIYAVMRKRKQNGSAPAAGLNGVFRVQDSWERPGGQSERGNAMFLSVLRVFCALAKEWNEPLQDAVLHVVKTLTSFPPTVRALHVMMQGNTPTKMEKAALSEGLYHVLGDLVPSVLINGDPKRWFEGTRLLFGLVTEKAKHIRLAENTTLPYLSNLQTMDLRCSKTQEPLWDPINTASGLVEKGYYDAFLETSSLSDSRLQECLQRLDDTTAKEHVAILSGGQQAEVVAYSMQSLETASAIPDPYEQHVVQIITPAEMRDVDHLAELCGRNDLGVLRPSSLASAEVPRLAFDREGHVAVYTGKLGCAEPGHDTAIFRPHHGEEVPDLAVIEQLLVPILERYEADGTAVFDAHGGAQVRRLEAPEEIVMFCVDCSQSMGDPVGFQDVGTEEALYEDDVRTGHTYIDPEIFSQVTLDDTKEMLCSHETFDDMLSAVSQAQSGPSRRQLAVHLIEVLGKLLEVDFAEAAEELEQFQQSNTWGYRHHARTDMQTKVDRLQRFIAGLRTHEQALVDFIRFRATNVTLLNERWSWNIGDPLPGSDHAAQPLMPALPPELVELPSTDYRCPISYDLLTDPVTAADGHTYSRQAISQWFQIRQSSPLTGLPLETTDVTSNPERAEEVDRWIGGDDLLPPDQIRTLRRRRRPSTNHIQIKFFSLLTSFERDVPPMFTVIDLYRLAFRGTRARHTNFRLFLNNNVLEPSEDTITTKGITAGSHVHIKAGDDIPTVNGETETQSPEQLCLIKVYSSTKDLLCSFWVPTGTKATLASVLMRYWAHIYRREPLREYKDVRVWTNTRHGGDNSTVGSLHNTDSRLSNLLTRAHAKGVLGHEDVFTPQDAPENDDVSDEDSVEYHNGRSDRVRSSQPLVLKVLVVTEKKDCSNTKLSRLESEERPGYGVWAAVSGRL
ncbi:hypothetical protein M8818_003775 [Zalaria obscura]|uniref:Uncharacterized protein n=1 Tax=Zalaria obscura TaxID=2024903 RepID=A0ACC3SF61_9PEZI